MMLADNKTGGVPHFMGKATVICSAEHLAFLITVQREFWVLRAVPPRHSGRK